MLLVHVCQELQGATASPLSASGWRRQSGCQGFRDLQIDQGGPLHTGILNQCADDVSCRDLQLARGRLHQPNEKLKGDVEDLRSHTRRQQRVRGSLLCLGGCRRVLPADHKHDVQKVFGLLVDESTKRACRCCKGCVRLPVQSGNPLGQQLITLLGVAGGLAAAEAGAGRWNGILRQLIVVGRMRVWIGSDDFGRRARAGEVATGWLLFKASVDICQKYIVRKLSLARRDTVPQA